MKKTVFLILLMISSSVLSAHIITQDKMNDSKYVIKLGMYKERQNATLIANDFLNFPTYIDEKNTTKGIRYHLYAVNIATVDEAVTILKEIKTRIKDAFIQKIVSPKETPKPVIETKLNPPAQEQNLSKPLLPEPKKIIQPAPVAIAPKAPPIISEPITKEGITLKEALLRACERSNKIRSAKEKVIQAKYKLDEKRADQKPKVNLYSTAAYNYHHVLSDDGIEQDYPNGNAELLMTQNLYSGGKISNSIYEEEQNLKAAVAKYRSLVEEEAVNIIDAYLNIIFEKKSIDANRANMDDLQKILKVVTLKEQSGASTQGDLNYIKSNVENAASALVKAESKYQNARSYYAYFLGEENAKYQPAEESFDIISEEKEAVLARMHENNAKIEMTKAQILAAKYDLKSKKAPFRPNLDFIVSTKKSTTKSEVDPIEDKANAALSLSYNLYNGGKDEAALLGSRSKVDELSFKLADLEESTRFNTLQMYENMISAKDTLVHTQNEVEANKKVTTSYWHAFEFGEQDIQALLLAQRALNRSQLDEISEQKNYILGYFKLMAQTGELLQKVGIETIVNPNTIE